MSNHHMNTLCPICGSTKDNRAQWCRACSNSLCPSRLGTGEYKPITQKIGYVMLHEPNHPQADSRGYVKRSTLVLEAKLNRPIREGFHCHHINGIRADDSPNNLAEISPSDHMAFHNQRFKGRHWVTTECGRMWL